MADIHTAMAREIISRARARLVREVLKAIAAAGAEGMPVDNLRKYYDRLEVEPEIRTAIERQLTEHKLVKASGGRLFHIGTRQDYQRLADRRRDQPVIVSPKARA